jgi:hypothetical protein
MNRIIRIDKDNPIVVCRSYLMSALVKASSSPVTDKNISESCNYVISCYEVLSTIESLSETQVTEREVGSDTCLLYREQSCSSNVINDIRDSIITTVNTLYTECISDYRNELMELLELMNTIVVDDQTSQGV